MSEILDQIMSEEAEYKDASPDYVAADLYTRLGEPAGIDRSTFLNDVLQIDSGFGDEFGKAFDRSFAELKVLGTTGVAAAGLSGLDKILGGVGIESDGIKEMATEKAISTAEQLAELEKMYPKLIPTRHDVSDIESGLQYTGAMMGQGLGSTLEVLIPGILTGGTYAVASTAGKTAIKGGMKAAAKKFGKELSEEQLENQIKKGTFSKTFKQGLAAGTYGGAATAETGSTYIGLLKEGKDAPGTAIVAGALKGALEVLPEFALASKFMKTNVAKDAFTEATLGQIFKRAGLNIVGQATKTGSQEALTEAMQESIDIAAADFVHERSSTIFSPHGIDQLIESGLAGFIGGMPLGAVGGGVTTLKEAGRMDVNTPIFNEDGVIESYEDIPIPEGGSLESSLAAIPEELLTGAEYNTDPVDYGENHRVMKENIANASKFMEEQLGPTVEGIRSDQLNEPVESIDTYELSFDDIELGAPETVYDYSEVTEPTTSKKPATKPKKKPEVLDETDPEMFTAQEMGPARTTEQLADVNLPKDLAGAKPRYSFGNIDVKLDFENDTAKALYIAGSKRSSKRKADYVDWLRNTVGIDKPRREGALMRNRIKEQALRGEMVAKVEVPKGIAFHPVNKDGSPTVDQRKVKTQRLDGPIREISQRELRASDPEVFDMAYENMRGLKLKDSIFDPKMVQKMQDAVQKIAGPLADIKLYDSLMELKGSDIIEPVRGAQWLNTINVAFGFNTSMGYSNMETAMHEAFHFLWNNVLTSAQKATLENNRSRMIEFLVDKTGLIAADLEMFNTEELAATTFGHWTEAFLNKQAPTKFGPVNAIFKKLANILRKIRNSFRKQGISKFEDLFEDAAQGKLAMESVDGLNNLSRVVRLQQVVNGAHNKATNRLINSPLITENTLKKMIKGDTSAAMDFTNIQNFVTKMFNTAPGLAAKDKLFSKLWSVEQAQQQTMNQLDNVLISKMKELYRNKQRMVNAAGVLDILNSEEQELKLTPEGKVAYVKGNQLVTLDAVTSADVLSLNDGFKTGLKMWRETTNDKIQQIDGFENIHAAISAQSKLVIEIEREPEAHSDGATLSAKKRLDELKATQAMLKTIDKKLRSKVPYFPRMAVGRFGVKIKKVGQKDPLDQGFAIIGEDLNGRVNKKELQEVKRRWAEEHGYRGSEYTISEPFKLTKNSLLGAIDSQNAIFNLEMLASVMASGNPALMDDIEAALGTIGKAKAKTKIDKHFLERNDALLYSKDYAAVVPAYFSTLTRSVTRYRFAEANGAISNMIDAGFINADGKNVHLDPKQQKLYKEMWDYFTKPSTDMNKTRTFNFFMALGGNFSTAAIQLITGPTIVVGVMSSYGGNPISNQATFMRNFGTVSKMMAAAKFDVSMFGSEEFLAKYIKDPKTRAAVKIAHDRGEFRPARSEDMLGSNAFTSGKVGSGGFVDFTRSTVGKALSAPIQYAEEISRVTSFLSLYETLSKPNALLRLENSVVKGNHRYNAFKELNADLDPAIYASLFLIDDTHGLFGRLGRGRNQQGIWGALIFPFMQHPLMMMGLLNRMVANGGASRAGALYIMLSVMFLAGLYGIPGWELWKESIQFLYKETTGKPIELHHELKKAMVSSGTFSPKWAETLTEGVIKGQLDTDIARRIAIPIFFQDALVALMQGRDGVDQFAGVAGSQMKSVITDYNRVQAGEIGRSEMLLNMVSPMAFRNIYKAAAVYPNKGIRTGKGVQIMSPEDMEPMDMLKKAFGFQPAQISREYEKRYAEKLAGTGWRYGYDRRVKSLALKTQDLIDEKKQGGSGKELKAEIDHLYSDLGDFAMSANKVPDRAFWRGVRTSINNRINNIAAPDVPTRKYKTVDYDILDLLYERD